MTYCLRLTNDEFVTSDYNYNFSLTIIDF